MIGSKKMKRMCKPISFGICNDEKNVYIIEPLKDGSTKAHNLHAICNHGDEKQVNFTRGTSFKITKVITQKNGLKLIYMKELP